DHGVRDADEPDGFAGVDRHGLPRRGQRAAGFAFDLVLDAADDGLRLVAAPADEEPARALRYVPADEQDGEPEDDAEPEGDAPADVDGQVVEQRHGEQGASGGAEPVAAVDEDVDAAAVLAGDEFVDGGVDGRVFAADAEPGQKPEQEEPPHTERERGGEGGP